MSSPNRPAPLGLTQEFLERRDTPVLHANPADGEAIRFARSWHRFPGFAAGLWYRGINLGEVFEYGLVVGVIEALSKRDGGPAR